MAKLSCSTCIFSNRDGEKYSLGLCLNNESENFALRMSPLDSCKGHRPAVKDLSFGIDQEGDHALFIDETRIDGHKVDKEVKNVIGTDAVYFRALVDGKESSVHGWIKKKRIVMFL